MIATCPQRYLESTFLHCHNIVITTLSQRQKATLSQRCHNVILFAGTPLVIWIKTAVLPKIIARIMYDSGAYYVFSVYETDSLFNTSPNANFEDVLNFKVNDTNVSLVVDSGAFYDMMSETAYQDMTSDGL